MMIKRRSGAKAPKTDVEAVQLGITGQIPTSKRFKWTVEGNQCVVTDARTSRKVVVPLFAARVVVDALDALFIGEGE